MRNLRLDICYDGTRYRGWQRLPGDANTIQGKLEQTLSRILGEEIEISGSGRTDAGVHAAGQVANFHCSSTMPADEILAQLRRYLPNDIGIYSCREVSPRFHARLNAKQKTYCYHILNSDRPDVFNYCTNYREPAWLNTAAMQQAGSLFVGQHDFAAFCTKSKSTKSTVRTIKDVTVLRYGDQIQINITADGFLYNMMRIIVGTLIEVGRGVRSPESIPPLFNGKRQDAGFLAPAQGLCLLGVEY